MSKPKRILVIRLGALGDLVLCFQAFHEIRQAHPDAEIALLTMPAYADFARRMPWFDKIILDERAPLSHIGKWVAHIRQIRTFNPTRVYDLQGKLRQTLLYLLLGCPRGWSGAAPLCSYPRLWPPEPGMHFTDFVAAQLRRANVPQAAPINFDWLDDPLKEISLPHPYVVLIAGCAQGRDYKRWPAKNYAALAAYLQQNNLASVAVGTKADAISIQILKNIRPDIIDLSGQTDLYQLAAVLRRSHYVIGNDTGPTHLAAALGASTLALMPSEVNVTWSAPRGSRASIVQGDPLAALSVNEVLLALGCILDKTTDSIC